MYAWIAIVIFTLLIAGMILAFVRTIMHNRSVRRYRGTIIQVEHLIEKDELADSFTNFNLTIEIREINGSKTILIKKHLLRQPEPGAYIDIFETEGYYDTYDRRDQSGWAIAVMILMILLVYFWWKFLY